MAISYGTYTITEVQEGSQIWTTTVAPKSPNYTFTISNLTGDSDTSVKVGDIIMYSYYRYTVLSMSADGTTVLAGNRVSIRGGTGPSAVTYSLIVSNLAIVKDKNSDISPTSITLTAKSQTGSSAMTNYTGRFKIETTTDNSTWTTQYTSSANESTTTWNVIDDIVAIRCNLYLKDGTTTLLDQQTIPVISDGIDGTNGTNGKDAYTIILTNENHTFAGNTTSAIASEIECNVIAYKGATQVASTIGTITGQPTGMTTTLLNNGTVNTAFKVNVTTSMVTKNGVLTIPITIDGKTFTKEFTYALTLDGEDGKDGGRWYSGTKITGTSTTASVFSGSGITSAVVGDMYLNTSTYNTYRCTLGGNASTAKWVYVNNIKGTTGKGISSVTNQYYLSTSDTTQADGSWSDSPQAYVEGRYYWTRSHIVWDNGSSPTDTTPVLDSALTDANANAINARKVAINYLSNDSTGIMVADMNDGRQTPSTATGNNVFINNSSVNIRNGQNTLASFGSSGIQIGTSSTSVNIDEDSFDLKRNSNEYVHLGYGEGNAQSGTAVAPYYSIGTRKANSAVGNYSVAEGSNNEASGYASNAQGYNNTASGLMSHAEGYNNTASGAYSSAEGSGNTVSGTTSHVGGLNSTVSGNGSFTHGYGLLGSGDNQAVFGRYNIEDTNYEYAMIIGNGTVDENYTPVRSNLLTVGWDGNIRTASGFDTSMPPFKWKSASYTASNLASGYTDVTTNVSFPNLAGYSKTIMVVGTNSAYTGATGAYIDNNNKVHIRCRNFSSSTSSPTISFILIYLNNTYTWT